MDILLDSGTYAVSVSCTFELTGAVAFSRVEIITQLEVPNNTVQRRDMSFTNTNLKNLIFYHIGYSILVYSIWYQIILKSV